MDLRAERLAFEGAEGRAVARDDRNLPVLQEDHPARVLQNGRHIGRDEHLAVAEAHRDAAGIAEAGRHQRLRLALGQHHDRAGAAQLRQRQPHRLDQRAIALIVQPDQVGNHLGVRLRLERDSLGLQLGAQLSEVLDDAVLHDHQLAGEIHVRMRVALARLAVGCPARVADADVALDRRLRQPRRQVAQLADIAPDSDLPILDDGDPCRVIPAIFQPPQAVHDDLGGVARPDVADNSTHNPTPSLDEFKPFVLRRVGGRVVTLHVRRQERPQAAPSLRW